MSGSKRYIHLATCLCGSGTTVGGLPAEVSFSALWDIETAQLVCGVVQKLECWKRQKWTLNSNRHSQLVRVTISPLTRPQLLNWRSNCDAKPDCEVTF